ncbi:hypothetical protein D3C71_1622980 [compost metagenome]
MSDKRTDATWLSRRRLMTSCSGLVCTGAACANALLRRCAVCVMGNMPGLVRLPWTVTICPRASAARVTLTSAPTTSLARRATIASCSLPSVRPSARNFPRMGKVTLPARSISWLPKSLTPDGSAANTPSPPRSQTFTLMPSPGTRLSNPACVKSR